MMELEACWSCDRENVNESNAVGAVDEGDYSAFICQECGTKPENAEHLWEKAMEGAHGGPLTSEDDIRAEEQYRRELGLPDTPNLDPNHGHDLDYIALISQENAIEDAIGFLCWDTAFSPGPKEDIKSWLDFFCSEHEVSQYPNLLKAFVGVINLPELTKPRLVYCSVAAIGIIARETYCSFEEAMEDFSYNYEGNGGQGQPVFIHSRTSRSVNN